MGAIARANSEGNPWYSLHESSEGLTIRFRGSWRLAHINEIYPVILREWRFKPNQRIFLDGSELDELDTSGVMLVRHVLREAGVSEEQVVESNVKPEHSSITKLVRENLAVPDPIETPKHFGLLERAGIGTINALAKCKELLAFIGQTSLVWLKIFVNPRLIRFRESVVQLERVCVDAVPIAALVTFLIGIVVAYLFSIQSEKYGANLFIVDAAALAMCRELSPIIVAIIVAGRSGSAFTAQIGAMKLNDEIDALESLGLSPMQVLVVPRMLALIIAMPLLVFVGDVVGIFGAMIIADLRLGITSVTFIDRLNQVLPVRSLLVGLIKAPVFAAFIAVIGCKMGLSIERNATSLGLSTTSTVVQSIVSVILLNAAFAIIFVELGI
ncbi:MAG: ABC transporter permease [Bdellovibrionales bacterium]|nr:ABC transporter permease [Bdellovibrionales bacterium]